jgi:hypothetical protein
MKVRILPGALLLPVSQERLALIVRHLELLSLLNKVNELEKAESEELDRLDAVLAVNIPKTTSVPAGIYRTEFSRALDQYIVYIADAMFLMNRDVITGVHFTLIED